MFSKAVQLPSGDVQLVYCKTQEAVRKCLERLFGVFLRRYKVIFVSSELLSAYRMKYVAFSADILHNMTVDKCRDNYIWNGVNGFIRYYEDYECDL